VPQDEEVNSQAVKISVQSYQLKRIPFQSNRGALSLPCVFAFSTDCELGNTNSGIAPDKRGWKEEYAGLYYAIYAKP
jgi:hypothetical protein